MRAAPVVGGYPRAGSRASGTVTMASNRTNGISRHRKIKTAVPREEGAPPSCAPAPGRRGRRIPVKPGAAQGGGGAPPFFTPPGPGRKERPGYLKAAPQGGGGGAALVRMASREEEGPAIRPGPPRWWRPGILAATSGRRRMSPRCPGPIGRRRSGKGRITCRRPPKPPRRRSSSGSGRDRPGRGRTAP